MPRAMVRSGRSGWYYRVLEVGCIRAGDTIALVDRPHPGFDFTRLVKIVNFGRADMADIQTLASMDGVAAALRTMAQHHVQNASR